MKVTRIEHDGSHAALKLRRDHILGCKVGKLSKSFSHEKELLGMQLHAYCTDEGGVVVGVVYGTVRRVSHKSAKRWALFVQRIEDLASFNTAKIVRLE